MGSRSRSRWLWRHEIGDLLYKLKYIHFDISGSFIKVTQIFISHKNHRAPTIKEAIKKKPANNNDHNNDHGKHHVTFSVVVGRR